MAVINGIDYANPSQFVNTGSSSTPKSNLGFKNTLDFSGFQGSFSGDSGSVSGSISGRPSPNLPMSYPGNITPSASINPYLGRQYSQQSYQRGYQDSQQSDSSEDAGYTMSDAELWNMQLQNAVMMKSLGYGVDFQDGEMQYSKVNHDSLTPYGAYGYQQDQNAVYETDWLMANQAKVQPVQERYTYPPSNYQRNNYGYQRGYQRNYNRGYQRPYSRNGYYSRYYSGYTQRYNGYNGYYGNQYSGYNRYGNNRYARDKNGYNRNYSRYNNNNRNRWYG